MTSSILEVVASARSKRFNSFVIIIALCLAIALSGDRAAAAPSDAVDISSSLTYLLYIDRPIEVQSSNDNNFEYVVPLYIVYNGSVPNNSYMSGFVAFSSVANAFTFKNSAGQAIAPTYFEHANINNISCDDVLGSNSFLIYFDNHLSAASAQFLLGYYHFKFAYTGSTSNNLNISPTYYTLNRVSAALYRSSASFGIYDAVKLAIDNSTDINSIITILDGIRNYTALLNSILDYLSQNRTLTEIYNQLVTSNQTQSAIYQEIYNYIHDNNSGAQAASQAAGSAATQAANQAAAEASLAALSPGNMADLDSALNDFDLLDTVQQSTTFWTYCVNQFSTRSGALWGIFVFGLIIGLIAFILRLRR